MSSVEIYIILFLITAAGLASIVGVVLLTTVGVPSLLDVAVLSRFRKNAGPLPGQRWAIANGPTVEVLSIDADGKSVTCRFPDGREEPIPAAHLRQSGRLLRADDAIPEIADARRKR